MDPSNVRDHVALVTGGNHGIGAAAARALAARGTRVVVSYLRLSDAVDPGIPDEYRRNRAMGCFILIDEQDNRTLAAGMILGLAAD